MIYCDSCGRRVSTEAKYCRYCGRQLRVVFEDTQPLPIINDTLMLASAEKKGYLSSCYSSLSKQTRKFRVKKHAIISYFVSLAIIAGLIYVLINFKTVDEYRYLTGSLGLLLALYFYRSA